VTQVPPVTNKRALAVSIASQAMDMERQTLLSLSLQLLQIRESSASPVTKAKEALALTAKISFVWPIVKIMGRELKRFGWDERGAKSPFAIIGAGAGASFFGG